MNVNELAMNIISGTKDSTELESQLRRTFSDRTLQLIDHIRTEYALSISDKGNSKEE
jgi:predicted transcriptional regulator